MTNGFIYKTICTCDDNNRICANFDEERMKYYMPYLHMDIHGKNLVWDNFTFVVEEFYPFLKRWQEKKITIADELQYPEIWDLLTEDWAADIIEIIEKAIELKWDEV